ncbi:MAG: type II toxin-antitoxin system PemK/MazF family toxin [Synechococcaceae cyanobacterium SM2_3_2]|nr:type II toxin-antitoxin system PemK/MazF family toxin [Synechococcaceae cyanobacterium SM2_3_2]
MATFVRGSVVVTPFPFSDLSQTKRRPAFVVTSLPGDDLLLCQITSQSSMDPYAIEIQDDDFLMGGLYRMSYVRVGKLFTADKSIILYVAGQVKPEKTEEIITKTIEVIQGI